MKIIRMNIIGFVEPSQYKLAFFRLPYDFRYLHNFISSSFIVEIKTSDNKIKFCLFDLFHKHISLYGRTDLNINCTVPPISQYEQLISKILFNKNLFQYSLVNIPIWLQIALGDAIKKLRDNYALNEIRFSINPPSYSDADLVSYATEFSDAWRNSNKEIAKTEIDKIKKYFEDNFKSKIRPIKHLPPVDNVENDEFYTQEELDDMYKAAYENDPQWRWNND